MFSHNMKRAVKVGLLLCAFSLPVLALDGGADRHHHHGGCGGNNRDCGGGGGGGNNVPEGGSLLAYTCLSGAMIAGGMVLARKPRTE
jgi:hypothetical protein